MTFARHACFAAAIAFLAAPACTQQNEQQPPPRDPKRPIKVDPTYQKLADETGGTVYVLDREHPEQMGIIMAADLAARRPLLTTHGAISGERAFEAVLEGTESKLVVTATGVQSLQLKRPDGIAVVADGVLTNYAKLGNGGMFVVSNPEAGTWTAVLTGEGNFSLRMNVAPGKDAARDSPVVSAAASQPSEDIEFDSFEFQQIAGRPGHQGLFKIDGFPVAGKTYPVEAKISGEFSTVRFEFRTADDRPLQTLQLRPNRDEEFRDQRVYAGDAPIPEAPFRIYATGLDMHGQRYQRVLSQIVRPQSFTVAGPGFDEWQAGRTATCTFTITNFGPADNFEATIVDTAKFLRSEQKVRFALASGESKPLELTFDIPLSTAVSDDLVIVTVMRGTDPNATNHAIVEPMIVRHR